MTASRCLLCGIQLKPGQLVQPEVRGFEHKSRMPSRRSGSDVICREPTGRLAHEECIRRKKSGVHVGQEQLL